MVRPIEMLTRDEARAANEIIVRQVAVLGEDVSWDWVLRSLSREHPLATSAYRSTMSEARDNLETAVGLTLRQVGLKLEGGPVEQSTSGSLIALRYRVAATE